ncbi:Nuclear pore complex subunit [Halocaridina rubra]|uniref:Nuclear pore complex subunit n=1 Tax=Halocaridina rubra TaxID=373956 RepID=A0AAN8WM73_HALRR
MEELFTKEVLLWRSVRTLSCCILLQMLGPVALCSVFYTVSQGILNPEVIASNVIYTWLPPMRLMPPVLCFLILTHVFNKSYTVSAWVPITRWEAWKRGLSLSIMWKSLLLVLSSIILTNFYTTLANPDLSSIFTPCLPEDVLCRKRKAFIFYMGMLNGFRYGYYYFMDNGNLLTLSPAYPSRLQQLKSKLTVPNICVAYDRHGPSIISFLILGIALNMFNGSSWSDGIVILDFPLMVTMVLATFLLAITLKLFTDMFEIFIAEPIEIPLTTLEESNPETNADSWRLSHALSSGGLLQLIAFWDLKSIAACEPRNFERRSQVFSISQPGGHPRNWLGIMKPSLNLIRKFTERLRRHNCPEEFPKEPPKPTGVIGTSTDVNKNAVVVKPPSITFKERISKILDSLKKYPIFGYFLAELPDATNRSIFAEALPVIWAVQALGDLIAASFTEDKYGVTQRNIPDILMAFVQLQKVVDSLSRGTISKRAGTSDNLPAEFKLRRALRSSLRSSLYNVTTTFGGTILNMPLSSECQSKLQSYLDFKEG